MKYLFLIACQFCFSFAFTQTDSFHYFNSFDNTRIYYEDHGNGYPVLLVHGFVNTSQNWKRTYVYKALLDAGYRVIILDLRGNGKSDKPQTAESYANDAEAKDIMALISWLKIREYDVVGYSRGSIITARLLVFDKRVHKAVSGGMGTDFTDPEWPRRKMLYQVLDGDTTIQELEPLLKRIRADTSLNRKALALQQKEQPATSVSAQQRVNQPVLVLCGTNDSDNGNAQELAALFKNGKFANVPGDHGFAITTKEFGDQVLSFLMKSKN